MHVEKIELRDVRQFKGKTYRFKPGFNLLIGENGAGKTTILRSLVVALGSRLQSGKRSGFYDGDIHLGGRHLQTKVSVEFDASTTREFVYERQFGGRSRWHGERSDLMVLYYGSSEAATASLKSRRVPRLSRDGSRGQKTIEESLYDGERNYSGDAETGQSFGDIREVRKFTEEALAKVSPDLVDFYWRFEAYKCVILPSPNGKKEAIKGSKDLCKAVLRYLQENPDRLAGIDQKKIQLHPKGHLLKDFKSKPITPPFDEILKSMEMTDNIEELSGLACELNLTPRIVVRTANGEFLLNQLSDGQQRIFSLIVDIARVFSTNEDVSIKDTKGVVLIDEIDHHLHPRWQRIIVPALEDLFPQCQFIATTHSPFVVQAVRGEALQHLNDSLLGDVTNRGIEEIAFKAMGIEDHEVSERYLQMLDTAKEYFQLLETAKTERDDRRVVELKKRLRHLSTKYSENPAYQAYLEMHEHVTFGSKI